MGRHKSATQDAIHVVIIGDTPICTLRSNKCKIIDIWGNNDKPAFLAYPSKSPKN
jgi:hypothetical protein